MAYIQLDVMNDFSEIVHYDKVSVPLYIRKGILSNYLGGKAVCHWHDDFEVILVQSGTMNYYVNGHNLLLKENDALFVNSRQMHYGYENNDNECEFICILFHPSLLAANKALFENFISPLLGSSGISYMEFNKKTDPEIVGMIEKIYNEKINNKAYYEIMAIGYIYSFLAAILRSINEHHCGEIKEVSNDSLLLRKMVSFIHEHFKESISLNDIAGSANICKSKCCSLFQQQIRQSPFEFLNMYRLKKSAELLEKSDMSVTDISLNCGFNNASYYAKLFSRFYKCTPKEYRKKAKE